MKKSILNLGKALNKVEQKNVLGGNVIMHKPEFECTEGQCNNMPNRGNIGRGGGSVFVQGVCRGGQCYYA